MRHRKHVRGSNTVWPSQTLKRVKIILEDLHEDRVKDTAEQLTQLLQDLLLPQAGLPIIHRQDSHREQVQVRDRILLW